jgi:hypothetical protein
MVDKTDEASLTFLGLPFFMFFACEEHYREACTLVVTGTSQQQLPAAEALVYFSNLVLAGKVKEFVRAFQEPRCSHLFAVNQETYAHVK